MQSLQKIVHTDVTVSEMHPLIKQTDMNLFLISFSSFLTIIYDQLYILMPTGATLKCSDFCDRSLIGGRNSKNKH